MGEKTIKIPVPNETDFSINAGFNCFEPAPELNEFFEETILSERHFLFNIEHIHLAHAHIGFLWTDVENSRKGRSIAGTAEIPMFRCDKWTKARQEKQIEDWFGKMPDFIITLSAGYWLNFSDIERLALLEHELYHCAQATDLFGMPRFSKETGKPVFAMRGHDFEEFIGVVRRYGIQATGQDGIDLVEAALSEPVIARANVEKMCGAC